MQQRGTALRKHRSLSPPTENELCEDQYLEPHILKLGF